MRPRPGIGKRRIAAAMSALMLVTMSVAGGLGVTGDTTKDAKAAEPLSCGAGIVYAQDGNGNLVQVDLNTPTPTSTTVGDFGSGSAWNLLGVTQNGTDAWASSRSGDSNRTAAPAHYNAAAGTFTSLGWNYSVSSEYGSWVAGANDLSTGDYYIGAFKTSGSDRGMHIFKLDQAGSTFNDIGYIDTTAHTGATNGDFAFDKDGNFYLVGSSNSEAWVWSASAAAVQGGTGGLIAASEIGTVTGLGGAVNGIAFDQDGSLLLGTSNQIRRFNPSTGLVTNTYNMSGVSSADLASCSSPSTISVHKNVQRVNSSDQFTLTLQNASNTTVATATTTGTTDGLQNKVAGPVFATAGATYSIAEAMAAGSASALSAYTTSWSCVDTSTSPATSIASGTTAAGSFTVPTNAGQAAAIVDCTFTNVPAFVPNPELTLVKSTNPTTYDAVGDIITYNFDVENTGNETIDNLSITEGVFTGSGSLSAISCLDTTLAPGDTTRCSATYTITQADVDAGSVNNTATAHGTDPSNNPVDSNESSATITSDAVASLTLAKSASPINYDAPGDTITYTFRVTNNGAETVDNLSIVEGAFSGSGSMSAISCPVTTLASGAFTDCTATYQVTQPDLDAGSVNNTATAQGTDPSNGSVTSNQSDATVNAYQDAALNLVKSASPTTYAAVGDTITYTFRVTNTGNVAVSGVNITEDSFSGSGSMSAISCPVTTLASGAFTDCTATYQVTQADLDAGSVDNTATAHGTDPSNNPIDSNESNATITSGAQGSLSLIKSANPTSYSAVGDTVTYSFAVTNTGPLTIDNLNVSEDGFSGTGTMSAISCPVTTLTPGASTTCTATYSVTQDDLDAGQLDNSATAHGTDPSGNTVDSNLSQERVTADQTATLGLVKSANPTSYSAVGQTITYSFLVENTGNVTLTGLNVTEDAFSGSGSMSAITCPVTTLVPGASTTCTATYQVTQADLDAGSVTNTATAHGVAPIGEVGMPVDSDPSDATVTSGAQGSLSLVKSANPTSYSAVGETITYSFAVTNNGPLTIDNLSVTEGSFTGSGSMSSITCLVTTLAPGGSTTCTATYQVTQADLDAGSVDNTATAHGTDPSDNPVDSNESNATVTSSAQASLSLVKSANPTTYSAVGETITYSFAVTNTGGVTVDIVSISDVSDGAGTLTVINCPITTLAPTVSTTCTATYQVTQADLDAGSVNNTATVHGATPPTPGNPNGTPVESNPSDATVTADQAPGLSVVKSADVSSFDTVGQTITYSFLVTNTGNVTMSNIAVSDTGFSGSGSLSAITCPTTTLAPSAFTTCTATYQVTQADLEAGQITNSASVTGTPPGTEEPLPPTPSNEVDIPADWNPALSLVKSADPTTFSAPGASVTYSFVVTNTGNVTVYGLNVAEDAFSGSGSLSAITCPVSTLAPGAFTTCTATYSTTQLDLNAGSVDNSATAHAETNAPPGGEIGIPVDSNQSDATVTADQAPGLSVVKSADVSSFDTVGQTITYSFLVTNTGNVEMSNVAVSETSFSGSGSLSAITCPATTLAPGAFTTCTATYEVTQADIDAGQITNSASVTGTPPGTEEPLPPTPSNEVDIPADQNPALSLVKSADPTTVDAAGDLVTYSFAVTNTGNVTVNGLNISEDVFSGSGSMSAVTCPATTLAPGDSTTCTATYAVTQIDVDAGAVDNTATAHGTTPGTPSAPNGTPVQSNQSDATVTADQVPGLSVVKSADVSSFDTVGQTITYSFLVTNTGNVTVSNIAVSDTGFSGSGSLSAISCPATTLAPSALTTCTATYQVTQADLDAGQITNSASVTGTPPGTEEPLPPTPSNEVEIPADQNPALSLVKSADPTTVDAAGDSVSYSFVVTNTGNVTLTAVNVTEDAFSGSGSMSAITCPVTTLAPGDWTTCTATYTITQIDMDAGSVENTATAHGTPPNPADPPVDSEPSDAVVDVDQQPSLSLVKSADPTTIAAAGETIDYSFLVTNTGNVTLDSVDVSDDSFTGSGSLSAISCPTATLAPGEFMTCTASYDVTLDDMNNGADLVNTATAYGTPPGWEGPVYSDPSDATVTIEQLPAIAIVKSADPTTVDASGDTVTYSFEVTNTGNVTLADVNVTEDAFSGSGSMSAVSCPGTTLDPGDSMTCTATYTITQIDMDAGSVENTATAHGTPPGTETPVDSEPSDAVVDVDQRPSLSLVKSADPVVVDAAGDVVTYGFAVTNTGNVTIDNLTIAEDAFSGTGTVPVATCGATTLAPGASTTCTATYTVTQADMDRGSIENTATAHGDDPNGDDIPSDPSDAVVDVDQQPSLSLVKSADPVVVDAAGDVVTYSFAVTNTGNVTIDNLMIAEDSFTGTGSFSSQSCPATTLAPGESTTCTATYPVTQADMDRGSIENTATAHGDDPNGDDVPSNPSDATVDVDQQPSIALVKSASPTTMDAAGQTVTYTFAVTNTGNVTIHDLGITETSFTGSGSMSSISCPSSVAPGETANCTATYSVTQADMDRGSIENTATAHGTDPNGDPVETPPSDAVVDVDQRPALGLVKTADPVTVDAAGDTVTYTFAVTNTGNVTIHGISISEDSFTGTGAMSGASCSASSLAPGESTTCTATYSVTQADMDRGSIENTATAHGTDPNGQDTPSNPSDATVDVDQRPGLELDKSATPTTVTEVDQTVTYSFAVTNTGNVTIHGIEIDEVTFTGTGTMSAITCPTTTVTPGQTVTCTATYQVTQEDILAEAFSNTAIARGQDPNDSPIDSNEDTVVVTTVQQPSIEVVKSADPLVVSQVGDTVTYTYTVTNNGNVPLDNVMVTETFFSGTGTAPVPDCSAIGALLPDTSGTCTATYQVTQADLDSGAIDNAAIATGTDPKGEPTESEESEATVTTEQNPKLDIAKSATPNDLDNNGRIEPGDTITWHITVTNTGNVTIRDITVSDPSAGAVTCPETTLDPGESMDCTVGDHTITEADAVAGTVENVATATGQSISGMSVDTTPATASVDVVKSQSGLGGGGAGGILPKTGAALLGLIGMGGVLAILGFFGIVAGRRRRMD